MDQNVVLAKLIICKSNPIEKGIELMDQLWCEGWQRDFDVLMLHDLQDLQALGSLTTIWWHLSDTWYTYKVRQTITERRASSLRI